MEKEDSFKNWPAVDAPSSFAAPGRLPQSVLGNFNPGLVTIGHFNGFGSSVCAALQPQQWSSAAGTDHFGSHGLSSPPELSLSLLSSFLQGDRAARMPCFGPGVPNYGSRFPLSETGRLPRGSVHHFGTVGSNNEIPMSSRSSTAEEVELRCVRAESSASEQSNARKRKLVKAGEEGGEAVAKRSRAIDEAKPKIEAEKGAKEAEAPKQDYIHVRARRGQATDAHSLAERVRREKISERMKLLQNLVPGCNKVTGKAVMLDEIINYVQSLQRQVEFLSMKLATVNPGLEISSVESPRQKDKQMQQARGSSPSRGALYVMESSAPSFPFSHQPPQGAQLQAVVSGGIESHCSTNPLDPTLTRRGLGAQFPTIDGLTSTGSSQAVGFWGDDLHRVVQMGYGQSQDAD